MLITERLFFESTRAEKQGEISSQVI